MSSDTEIEFSQIECQEFCVKVADGTHESPKQTQVGKRLATSKNIKDGQLNLDSAYLISLEDFEDINRRSKVEQWDILISMIGTVGEVCLVDTHAPDFAIKNVGLLKCKDKVHAKWLYYFFRSSTGKQLVEERKKGTTQQYISLGEIRRLPVSIPSQTAYMKDATEILSALDDRIALLRASNATLEAIAQALFKSWFVDFDPVHAKQQGIAPEGMDEATATLFPDGFEESALGLVPRGWKVGKFGDIAKTVKKQLQPSALHSELHYVGLEHIPRKSLSLSDWGDAEGLGSAKAAFSKDDILFGKLRPYFHKVVIAPFDGVCSTDILVCQSTNPAYYGLVAMHLFSKTLIDYAERLSNGAKMPRVNWKDLAAYPIYIPPKALAANYSEIIKPIMSRMTANVHQAQTLSTLRDTLLPRLISGQLRLPEAEAMREAVAG
jgi:type I restriction enzyme, S subunit